MPLPKQKHSDEELNELRMRNAFAVRPPVQQVKSMALHPLLVGVYYVFCLVTVGLAIGGLLLPGIVCAGLGLLLGGVIYWRKPRTRHHVAFICIISLLVLVFGSVYYLERLEQTDYDAQGPIGY